MKFGDYIKQQRNRLNLTQEELSEFTPSYIANIESGRKRPTKRETIASLAKALNLPDSKIDWLWMFSMLNKDPKECFMTNTSDHTPCVNEQTSSYLNRSEIILHLEAPESDIEHRLGPPDKKFIVPGTTRSKWIYENEGIHITFVNNKVFDITFK